MVTRSIPSSFWSTYIREATEGLRLLLPQEGLSKTLATILGRKKWGHTQVQRLLPYHERLYAPIVLLYALCISTYIWGHTFLREGGAYISSKKVLRHSIVMKFRIKIRTVVGNRPYLTIFWWTIDMGISSKIRLVYYCIKTSLF